MLRSSSPETRGSIVKFASTRLVARDIKAVVGFYEKVTHRAAQWLAPVDVVMEPKTMPWGNRAALFRDPEGTLVPLYTPVMEAAKQRLGTR